MTRLNKERYEEIINGLATHTYGQRTSYIANALYEVTSQANPPWQLLKNQATPQDLWLHGTAPDSPLDHVRLIERTKP